MSENKLLDLRLSYLSSLPLQPQTPAKNSRLDTMVGRCLYKEGAKETVCKCGRLIGGPGRVRVRRKKLKKGSGSRRVGGVRIVRLCECGNKNEMEVKAPKPKRMKTKSPPKSEVAKQKPKPDPKPVVQHQFNRAPLDMKPKKKKRGDKQEPSKLMKFLNGLNG